MPLPATFLELPTISAVQAAGTGFRLVGPSLDQIEGVATSPDGPWEKASISIEEGHEVLSLGAPMTGSACFLRLFGWPDLVLAVKWPPRVQASAPVPNLPQPSPMPQVEAPKIASAPGL